MAHDITGFRHEDIFPFISPPTEKQDKFQPKTTSRTYLSLKAELLKDGSAASVANPRPAAFLLNLVTADISHMAFSSHSELFLVAWICFVCDQKLEPGKA